MTPAEVTARGVAVRWGFIAVLPFVGLILPPPAYSQESTDTPDAALRALRTATDPCAQISAIQALGRTGIQSEEIATALGIALRSDNAWVSAAASDVLSAQGTFAFPILHAALSECDRVQSQALRALKKRSDLPPQLVGAVSDLVGDTGEHRGIRELAANVISEQRGASIRVFRGLLRSKDPVARELAVDGLRRTGAAAVLDDILRACRDSDPIVRAAAAEAWHAQGGSTKDVWAIVGPILESDHLLVRGRALQVVAALGDEATVAIDSLSRLLAEAKFGGEWLNVINILAGTGSPRAVKPLLTVLTPGGSKERTDWFVYRASAEFTVWRALSEMGPKAAAAVPALVRMLDRRQYGTGPVGRHLDFRLMAVETLGAIGPKARAAIPHLQRIAQSEGAQLRKASTKAIARIRAE